MFFPENLGRWKVYYFAIIFMGIYVFIVRGGQCSDMGELWESSWEGILTPLPEQCKLNKII